VRYSWNGTSTAPSTNLRSAASHGPDFKEHCAVDDHPLYADQVSPRAIAGQAAGGLDVRRSGVAGRSGRGVGGKAVLPRALDAQKDGGAGSEAGGDMGLSTDFDERRMTI